MAKRGLGRGLQALIPPDVQRATEDNPGVVEVPVSSIEPNTYQPRRLFREESLEELAASIREHGVVQPIVLRRIGEDRFELVTGERRWRACRKLGLNSIPAVIKDYTDQQITEIALIENIQREDLSPLEEAAAYRTLIDEFNLTQEMLASRVGKSRSFVANMLRLLNLPFEVQNLLESGSLSAGHARSLLTLPNERQLEIAKLVTERALSVRQTEELVKHFHEKDAQTKSTTGRDAPKKPKPDPVILDLQERLGDVFGTKVQFKHHDKGGKIEIEYYNSEDLDRILEIFEKLSL